MDSLSILRYSTVHLFHMFGCGYCCGLAYALYKDKIFGTAWFCFTVGIIIGLLVFI